MRSIGDAIVGASISLGLAPRANYLLTTVGRRTGEARTNPVQLVLHDGKKWLVAPYGEVSWVKNARVAGRVRLTRRSSSEEFSIRELPAAEAAPVLKRYLSKVPVVAPYFDAKRTSSVEDFEKEARRHPVFELVPRKG